MGGGELIFYALVCLIALNFIALIILGVIARRVNYAVGNLAAVHQMQMRQLTEAELATEKLRSLSNKLD